MGDCSGDRGNHCRRRHLQYPRDPVRIQRAGEAYFAGGLLGSQIWKPIYAILEGALEIVVANAQHIKKVPGRKTDVKDAEWIADLLCHGLLRSSFVPPTAPQVWCRHCHASFPFPGATNTWYLYRRGSVSSAGSVSSHRLPTFKQSPTTDACITD
jgi:hypothetical protein